MFKQLLRSFILLILLFNCNIIPVLAFTTGKEVVDHLVTVFSMWNGNQLQTKLRIETARYIAYQLMAKESIGSINWEKLNNNQKYKYTANFEKMIESKFYPRWHKLFSKGKLVINNEIKVDDEIYVKSILKLNNESDEIIWKLKNIDGELKLISLALGEKDLMNKLIHLIKKRYDKLGYDKFIKWLDKSNSNNAETE